MSARTNESEPSVRTPEARGRELTTVLDEGLQNQVDSIWSTCLDGTLLGDENRVEFLSPPSLFEPGGPSTVTAVVIKIDRQKHKLTIHKRELDPENALALPLDCNHWVKTIGTEEEFELTRRVPLDPVLADSLGVGYACADGFRAEPISRPSLTLENKGEWEITGREGTARHRGYERHLIRVAEELATKALRSKADLSGQLRSHN